jgi:hypothetical protein
LLADDFFGVGEAVPFRETLWFMGYPPLPPPSECLDWRGVRKNGLQNLERLGVRGQNIDYKELAGFFEGSVPTAIALTMICSL